MEKKDYTLKTESYGGVGYLTATVTAKVLTKSIVDELFATRHLVKIVIGPNVEKIDEGCFDGRYCYCVDFKEAKKLKEIGAYAFEYAHLDGKQVKLDHVVKIGEGAFFSAEIGGELSLPKLTDAGNGAFAGVRADTIKLGSLETARTDLFAYSTIKVLVAPKLNRIYKTAFDEALIETSVLPSLREEIDDDISVE